MIYLKDAENLLKSVILTVMVYYSKRKQIKISQENWYTERPEMQMCSGVMASMTLRKQCAMTHTECCHLGGLSSLSFQSVPWGSVNNMVDPHGWLFSLSLSGSRKDTMWPRAPGKQKLLFLKLPPRTWGKDQTSKDNSLLHIPKMSKHSILWLYSHKM